LKQNPTYTYHRFLDEAGDTTFYGKGKVPIVGQEGVSNCFILGMLKINEPLAIVRANIIELQRNIENDPYFRGIPSVEKKRVKNGYHLHATDDIPEIRKIVFDFIKTIDCSFECIVARKVYTLYENKHNGKEAEFYADILSHLLKNKLGKYDRLVLNIAERKKCTTHSNLEKGLDKALERAKTNRPDKPQRCQVVFNIQQPTNEPLLNIADYFCWIIQRVFEKGETRFYDYMADQVSLVIDLYDFDNYSGSKNYYSGKRRLTKDLAINKKSP
jgi:hypothetical protein